eukprot:1161064-Pelagomonas_calceolata.AAC.8
MQGWQDGGSCGHFHGLPVCPKPSGQAAGWLAAAGGVGCSRRPQGAGRTLQVGVSRSGEREKDYVTQTWCQHWVSRRGQLFEPCIQGNGSSQLCHFAPSQLLSWRATCSPAGTAKEGEVEGVYNVDVRDCKYSGCTSHVPHGLQSIQALSNSRLSCVNIGCASRQLVLKEVSTKVKQALSAAVMCEWQRSGPKRWRLVSKTCADGRDPGPSAGDEPQQHLRQHVRCPVQMAEIQAQALVMDLNNDGEVEILAGEVQGHGHLKKGKDTGA